MIQTPLSGHVPLEEAKYKEIRGFINEWLADQTIYCGHCGFPYFPGTPTCCEYPLIGKNIQHLQALFIENEGRKNIRLNSYGSNAAKTMRITISMPQDLLRKLERWHLKRFGYKPFAEKKDLRKFMKHFPMFCVMDKI
jgi:hypothetical protein